MGRMKDLYMEIQEQFEDGKIPTDFDFDAYVTKVSEAKMKLTLIQNEKLSNCCGANMSTLVSEDGPDYMDLGICPKCNDHCSTN